MMLNEPANLLPLTLVPSDCQNQPAQSHFLFSLLYSNSSQDSADPGFVFAHRLSFDWLYLDDLSLAASGIIQLLRGISIKALDHTN